MKLTTRTRYGLRAMLELAWRADKGPVSMETIASSQTLSRTYLHSLLTSLRRAGLVRSVRGIAGGFLPARPPGEVSVGDIVRALEGPLDLVPCLGDRRKCGRAGACVARELWMDLSRAMEAHLDGITLKDLADPHPREKRRPALTRSSPPAPSRRKR